MAFFSPVCPTDEPMLEATNFTATIVDANGTTVREIGEELVQLDNPQEEFLELIPTVRLYH